MDFSQGMDGGDRNAEGAGVVEEGAEGKARDEVWTGSVRSFQQEEVEVSGFDVSEMG